MRGLRATAITVVIISAFAVACARTAPPEVRPNSRASIDSTAQAQQALENFLEAWRRRDWTEANSILLPSRRFESSDPGPGTMDRLASSTPLPYSFEHVVQRPGDPKYVGVRAFVAPVRFLGPTSIEQSKRLDWMWILVQTRDGRWRVYDWGY